MNDEIIIEEPNGGSSSVNEPSENQLSSSPNSVDGPVRPGVVRQTIAQPPLSSSAGSSAVMATTDDALISKFSAVTVGYYHDRMLRFFVKSPQRRQPLINRGYYARVVGIRKVVLDFLEATTKECIGNDEFVQIVNVGAGIDPFFYWLFNEAERITGGRAASVLRYYEIDFPEIMRRKTNRIISLNKAELYSQLSSSIQTLPVSVDGFIRADCWKMIGEDLRDIGAVNSTMLAAGFARNKPTLFVIECVLGYLSTAAADAVVQWCSSLSSLSCVVNFEPFNPHDRFGDMMVKNLQTRGCPLLSIQDYPTLHTLHQRFINLGWSSCSIADMNNVYDVHLDKSDILRIEHLELFDEIEEWRLIQAHYYLAVAIKSESVTPIAIVASCPFVSGTNNAVVHTGPGGLSVSDTVVWTQVSKQQSFGSLAKLVDYWSAPLNQVDLPRFTTEQAKSSSHKDLVDLAQRMLSGEKAICVTPSSSSEKLSHNQLLQAHNSRTTMTPRQRPPLQPQSAEMFSSFESVDNNSLNDHPSGPAT